MVGTTDNKITYTISDASVDPLSIPFRFDDQSWIYVVAFAAEGGAVVNLTLGVDYTLGGSGVASTGTLTLEAIYLSGVTTGTKLVIYRIAPALQTLDLQYNTRLPAEALELALDWLAMANIDRTNIAANAWTFPLSDPIEFLPFYTIPSATERSSSQFPAFRSSDGQPVYLTAQEVAQIILAYFGDAPTAADVLAAISAVQPLFVTDTPTQDLLGNPGQLALLRGSILLNPSDPTPYLGFAEPLNALLSQYLVPAGETNQGELGTFQNYSNDGIDPNGPSAPLLQLWVKTGFVTGPAIRWIAGGYVNGIQIEGWRSTTLTPTPETAVWEVNDTYAEGDLTLSTVPSRVWINMSQTTVPDWRRLYTAGDFFPTALPISDPEVAGEFFLDGTVLNISLG